MNLECHDEWRVEQGRRERTLIMMAAVRVQGVLQNGWPGSLGLCTGINIIGKTMANNRLTKFGFTPVDVRTPHYEAMEGITSMGPKIYGKGPTVTHINFCRGRNAGLFALVAKN